MSIFDKALDFGKATTGLFVGGATGAAAMLGKPLAQAVAIDAKVASVAVPAAAPVFAAGARYVASSEQEKKTLPCRASGPAPSTGGLTACR